MNKWRGMFVGAMVTIVVLWWMSLGREFDIVVANQDAGYLDNIRLKIDGKYFSFGILSARKIGVSTKTYSSYNGRWPDSVHVTWVRAEDKKTVFERELSVPRPLRVGHDERLELMVQFKKDDVSAFPRVAESFKKKGLSYRYKDP